MSKFSFPGKVVFITGGSRGLGLTLARKFCSQGARVAILARDENELTRARDGLIRRGADVIAIQCDLLHHSHIESAVRYTIEHFGKIDILVNNAGIIEVGPLSHMTREDFERSMALHFWAPYELIMRVLPEMRKAGGGRIVNISSVGGKVAVPHMAPYCASKFALTGFSDSIRAELAAENILVTTVAPGMMRTGSHVQAKFKGDHESEYAWFASASALPLASISAERAAAKIVRACSRGKPFLMMPVPTRLFMIANAIFPNLTARVLNFANSLFPSAGPADGKELRSGTELRSRARVPQWLKERGNRAVAEHNEAS
ncbi:MAG: hypothetical protein QOI04_1866 [Verrucomicrobiota bacterium]|jgi:NAD(P)-dependent dehydrogenase (short-subunit alcohol dehydrogenase family)